MTLSGRGFDGARKSDIKQSSAFTKAGWLFAAKLSIKGAGRVPVVEHLPRMCQAVVLILASTAFLKSLH